LDPSEIPLVGFVYLDPADLEAGAAAVAKGHERTAEVIGSTQLRAL